MPLALQDHPRVVFERNPLKVVVAQVRYPPIYAIEQPAGVAAFQEAIRGTYPLAQRRGAEVAVSIGPSGLGIPAGQPGPWRFTTEDGAWTVAVSPDFLSIETSNYERFEVFHERFRAVLEAASATIRPSRRERLGLRYVNEISHPEASTVGDWQQFLHAELLGLASGEALQEGVTQAIQQVQVGLEEANITIRHGYVRSGDSASVYLLDIDVYDEKPSPFDVDDILEKASDYKGWVWRIFRGSITDALVEYLGPRPLET
jgi:uncharacterized protein (TIGR04255 family)